ncbi:hypothetical protein [Microbacterium testaceum]|uniref:hypothetical protein n=1 Tax=Microbacterium testaceum TaxID=2033 RepID=UPI002AC41CAC|nr:hypothetical protein [Microbacterium testaceum]MDZ5145335.1 hypothetical protein [Microbacterium testaceum]
MANIAVQPIILNDVALTVAADNYEAHVSEVSFTPSSSTVNWKGLTPASVFSFGTSSTWTATLAYAQDWSTTNSLSRYLFENEGKSVTMTFKPKKPATGTAPTWTATVIVAPGSIGGAVDTVATASVTLGVQGKPALATA